MKPVFENITLDVTSSLKIQAYRNGHSCETNKWHIHPEYELVYIKNGTGTLKIGTRAFNYSNGLLIFLKGNIPHTKFGNNDYTDNLEVVIQFKKEFITQKVALFPEFKKIEKFINSPYSALLFKQETIDKLAKEFDLIGSYSNAKKLISSLDILESLANCTSFTNIVRASDLRTYSSLDSVKLDRAFNYINNNYKNNIPIKVIANHVGLSANSFCRFFKKMTKQTFVHFLNEFRVNKAAEAIRYENKNISEAMFDNGFQNHSYFSKIFKKHLGSTPSNYAKQF